MPVFPSCAVGGKIEIVKKKKKHTCISGYHNDETSCSDMKCYSSWGCCNVDCHYVYDSVISLWFVYDSVM